MLEIGSAIQHYDYHDGVHTLAFSNDEFGEDKYIIIQWKDIYDAQDISLGHNLPYIELCGASYSQYGGVERVVLDNNKAHIFFADEARTSKISPGVTIFLGQDIERISKALRRAFLIISSAPSDKSETKS